MKKQPQLKTRDIKKNKNDTKINTRGAQFNIVFYIYVFIKPTEHIKINLGLLLL